MWNMVQRLHSRTSAVQSITPGDAGNAPTRSKKRVKRSPLPITVQVSQPAPAPAPPRRTSARKRNDRSQSTTIAKLARAPNRRSTRSSAVLVNILSRWKEQRRRRMEIFKQLTNRSQLLMTGDDDDDQCGGVKKGTTPRLAASKRRFTFEERCGALMEFKDEVGNEIR